MLATFSASAAPRYYTGYVRGVAVGGYDPVAYFTKGKPVKGSSAFSTKWDGVTWRFANTQNMEKFMSAPHKYAPQFGGYCAYAVGTGTIAKGNPNNWKICLNSFISGFNMPNPYSILGVPKSADDKAIKSAFRKLAMKYHPDQNADNKNAQAKFAEINQAYEIIGD
ncbi:Chaperone protein DnaJ [Nymphon striatum]|nr:Chaperone protein DnaJ [Nymphon striatum]